VFTTTVQAPSVTPRNGGKLHVLVSAGSNRKIGRRMKKGRWAGMEILSLTLEEHATCPATCQQWKSCYGDNLHL
jgi:hypothetical protein